MEQETIDQILRQALETLPYFVVVDQRGRVVFLSRDYGALLGVSPEAAAGEDVTRVIPNTRMRHVVKTGQAEIGSLMTLFDKTQGREITLVCNRLPIHREGQVIGALAVTTIKDFDAVDVLYQEIHRVEEENRKYREELAQLKGRRETPLDAITGRSAVIVALKRAIEDYAKSNLPILITGETGVGKEVFANAIHQLSGRKLAPYVKVNCAAIPKDLLEAELFGYADGAFSGAARGGKPGKFELANGGTILLDEIGEMPPALQAKLLRVLQEHELERVGGTKTIKLDLRFLCSTNRDIGAMAESGQFRKDLYYRINTVELNIPPLSARMEDVPVLCACFVRRVNQEQGLSIDGVSQEAMALLEDRDWPGNARELLHAVERAAVLCGSGILGPEHFAFLRDRAGIRPRSAPPPREGGLRAQRGGAEREAILEALEQARWNKTRAAQLLGVDRGTLYNKLKKYHIE